MGHLNARAFAVIILSAKMIYLMIKKNLYHQEKLVKILNSKQLTIVKKDQENLYYMAKVLVMDILKIKKKLKVELK